MTIGYMCDGPCGKFWTGRKIGAEVSFLFLVDEEGDVLPAASSQVCPNCSVSLFHTFGPSGFAGKSPAAYTTGGDFA